MTYVLQLIFRELGDFLGDFDAFNASHYFLIFFYFLWRAHLCHDFFHLDFHHKEVHRLTQFADMKRFCSFIFKLFVVQLHVLKDYETTVEV